MIKFNNEVRNYQIYYEGQHQIGDKYFSTLTDLVADGLITFYIELKAADYILALSSRNYSDSPYCRYTLEQRKKAAQKKADSNKLKSPQKMKIPAKVVTENAMLNRLMVEKQRNIVDRAGGAKVVVDLKDHLPNIHKELENSSSSRSSISRRSNNSVTLSSSTISPEVTNTPGEFEKPHKFKTHSFMGPHWCDFCANYLWGLVNQGVKCQDCGFAAHKHCSEKLPSDCAPEMKYVKRVFGVDLTTLAKATNNLIPFVVEKCVKEIERRGVHFEGLYRIGGHLDGIDFIRMGFDREGENIELNQEDDENVITSVLKLYLRSLPIPVITYEIYQSSMEIIKRDFNQESLKLENLKKSIEQLPPAHYHTLKYLMKHLHRVVKMQDTNKMTSDNLATIFAPTLFQSIDADLATRLQIFQYERELIEVLISHQMIIFGNE
ncbi:DgyrCDS11094 [Dimorphilus gyrociliatus]|uniref:Beta-chimaerin n=1 Tax=Dimorphilus gyrociliatus TaxID=2664684 RepID=A0A7I8W3B4_9ANNE|nr:DgyrCDS11094 [Dimorphilus gyrociliatus]